MSNRFNPDSSGMSQYIASLGIGNVVRDGKPLDLGPGTKDINQIPQSSFHEGERDWLIKREQATLSLPPFKVPARSKPEVIYQANQYRAKVLEEMKGGESPEKMVMGFMRPSSTTPLSDLKSMQISDMRVTQTHKGRYLIGRIVSQPWGAASIRFALEDVTGRAELCEIRYFPLKNIVTGPDLDRILPLGTILCIREPTFRLDRWVSEPPLVSVHSPTDVVFLRPDHPQLENVTWSSPSPTPSLPPANFQALGDSLADEGKLQLAVKAYSDGLFTDLSSKGKLVLQLKRAKLQLGLDNFASAVRGAASVVRMLDEGVQGGPGTMSGATLVMAKGYEGLRLFAKAESSYRRYLQLVPANSPRAKEGKEGQKRMRTNQVDASAARFVERNVNELDESRAWDVGYNLADWFGPIAIATIPGREGGRGIVTTRDVAPGELLMVEKAFVHGTAQETPTNLVIYGQDLAIRSGASAAEIRLVSNLVARLCDDPSSLSCVNALYGGPNYPSLVTPTLDQPAQRAFETEETPVQLSLDIDRLEAICSYNRFRLPLHRDDIPVDDPASNASALFLANSIFNHHCLPISTSSFHRDVSIIRARSFIKKGEEVFISYYPIGQDYDVRQNLFRPVFEKGICPCKVCKLDRLDGKEQVALRHKILQKEFLPYRQRHQAGVSIPSEDVARTQGELQRILARLESTYSSKQGPLRPELSDVYDLLSSIAVHVRTLTNRTTIDYRLKGFESAGAKLEGKGTEIKVIVAPVPIQPYLDPVLQCLMTSSSCLQVLPKDTAACLSWIRAAVDMERLLRQGTFASVRQRHSALLKSLKIVTLYNEAEKLSLRRKQ